MKCLLGYFLFAILAATLADEKKRNETCTTPNDRNGKCVPVNQCQAVYDSLSSRNDTVLSFVRRSVCGFDDEALVCCDNPGPISLHKRKAPSDTVNCGMIKESPRIVGGEVTDIGEFPWMVAIEYKSRRTGENTGVRCGGSVISDEFVLTSASCSSNAEYEPILARLGEWDLTKDPDCKELVANTFCADPVQTVGIKNVIRHPLFRRKWAFNDIALLRLDKKISFTDFVSPVCLPLPDASTPEPDVLTTATGWGVTENGTRSDILLKVELPILSNDVCREKLSVKTLSAHQFCAGGKTGKDTCSGDAGGPLMKILQSDDAKSSLAWYQFGITSSGRGCGREYPAIYTKVSDYVDWIYNVIDEYK